MTLSVTDFKAFLWTYWWQARGKRDSNITRAIAALCTLVDFPECRPDDDQGRAGAAGFCPEVKAIWVRPANIELGNALKTYMTRTDAYDYKIESMFYSSEGFYQGVHAFAESRRFDEWQANNIDLANVIKGPAAVVVNAIYEGMICDAPE